MTITTVYECQDCGCEWEDDELVCPACNSGNAVSFEEEVNADRARAELATQADRVTALAEANQRRPWWRRLMKA
jgi:predicted ATP-dependent serine protease